MSHKNIASPQGRRNVEQSVASRGNISALSPTPRPMATLSNVGKMPNPRPMAIRAPPSTTMGLSGARPGFTRPPSLNGPSNSFGSNSSSLKAAPPLITGQMGHVPVIPPRLSKTIGVKNGPSGRFARFDQTRASIIDRREGRPERMGWRRGPMGRQVWINDQWSAIDALSLAELYSLGWDDESLCYTFGPGMWNCAPDFFNPYPEYTYPYPEYTYPGYGYPPAYATPYPGYAYPSYPSYPPPPPYYS